MDSAIPPLYEALLSPVAGSSAFVSGMLLRYIAADRIGLRIQGFPPRAIDAMTLCAEVLVAYGTACLAVYLFSEVMFK